MAEASTVIDQLRPAVECLVTSGAGAALSLPFFTAFAWPFVLLWFSYVFSDLNRLQQKRQAKYDDGIIVGCCWDVGAISGCCRPGSAPPSAVHDFLLMLKDIRLFLIATLFVCKKEMEKQVNWSVVKNIMLNLRMSYAVIYTMESN